MPAGAAENFGTPRRRDFGDRREALRHDAVVRYREAGQAVAVASLSRDRESLGAELAMDSV